MNPPDRVPTPTAEWRIGRSLIVMTYVSVAILVIGVGLMVAAGISPLAGGPAFDLADLPAELAARAPAGVLWVGLIVVIATPIVRVIGAAITFGLGRQWIMVGVAVAILVVIVAGVVIALSTTV